MTAEGPRPRVGFLGVGWIGRHRMEAIRDTGAVDIAAYADLSDDMAAAAALLAPGAVRVRDLDEMLGLRLDGLVIATPSALHAEQALAALEAGTAVFCQKPLGRSGAEVRNVVDVARRADRLLAVDLSYRRTEGMERIRKIVQAGDLGQVYAADLVFHNAYGPDKSWFYDRALAGGGCVMDLGIHLIDLALWTLGFPEIVAVTSHLFTGGKPLGPGAEQVEDYAVATLTTAKGAAIRLACSWRLSAGRDAVIAAEFYGTSGGAAFRNVDGSFYDFLAERYRGTTNEVLAIPPDPWGGRAAADWAIRLSDDAGFSAEAEHLVTVATVLDRIYESADHSGARA